MAETKPAFSVAKHPEGFQTLANGRPLKTPKGHPLFYPTQPLAEKTATQLADKALEAPFYKLMSFAIDMDRAALEEELIEHFDTDLVCYFADQPADLAARQKETWQPILDWAEAQGIAPVQTTDTTAPLTQPAKTKNALKAQLKDLSAPVFVAAFISGKLAGSVLTGLAMAKGEVDARQAHTIAHTDELYQQRRYGADDELSQNLSNSLAHFREIEEFLELS